MEGTIKRRPKEGARACSVTHILTMVMSVELSQFEMSTKGKTKARTRVKDYLAMPRKCFLYELLQLLPGYSVIYVTDLDISTICKWIWAVGTNA